jgi:hypothetical protein
VVYYNPLGGQRVAEFALGSVVIGITRTLAFTELPILPNLPLTTFLPCFILAPKLRSFSAPW